MGVAMLSATSGVMSFVLTLRFFMLPSQLLGACNSLVRFSATVLCGAADRSSTSITSQQFCSTDPTFIRCQSCLTAESTSSSLVCARAFSASVAALCASTSSRPFVAAAVGWPSSAAQSMTAPALPFRVAAAALFAASFSSNLARWPAKTPLTHSKLCFSRTLRSAGLRASPTRETMTSDSVFSIFRRPSWNLVRHWSFSSDVAHVPSSRGRNVCSSRVSASALSCSRDHLWSWLSSAASRSWHVSRNCVVWRRAWQSASCTMARNWAWCLCGFAWLWTRALGSPSMSIRATCRGYSA
mmetsp:Transcript_86745/g.245997  ORF Transcript_86745/g.245997 Transcript_86745/m.245997 type:complete len:298 (-) Transcript_86745:466-1359(-)